MNDLLSLKDLGMRPFLNSPSLLVRTATVAVVLTRRNLGHAAKSSPLPTAHAATFLGQPTEYSSR